MLALCDKHLAKLSKYIVDRGLAHLVSNDPKEYSRRAKSIGTDGLNLTNYDAMVVAQIEIAKMTVDMGWPMATSKIDACPVCEADACEMTWWIFAAVNAAEDEWNDLQPNNEPTITE